MAKHLIGFGLFVSIVAFSVLAFSFFTAVPIPEISVVTDVPNPPKPWDYCDRTRKARIGEPRAIADRIRGEVTIYINDLFGTVDPSVPEFKANFAFYAVRGDEVRLVAVVDESLVNTTRRDFDRKWILRYDAEWLKNLSWEDNLYLVSAAWDDSSVTQAFSKETALPVLIRN